ncbi:unnamed protein product [Alternaria burnsii]|nr:unnamed protein product [Alternaria burnsii]
MRQNEVPSCAFRILAVTFLDQASAISAILPSILSWSPQRFSSRRFYTLGPLTGFIRCARDSRALLDGDHFTAGSCSDIGLFLVVKLVVHQEGPSLQDTP